MSSLIFIRHVSHCNFNSIFRLIAKDGKELGGGFTLVELVTVIAILGILSSIAVPAYSRYAEKARITACIAEIRMLEKGIFAYEGANGNLPNNLNNIGLGNVLDPWGNPYQYLPVAGTPPDQLRKDRFLVPLNSDFFQGHQASFWHESDKYHGSRDRVSGKANSISNLSTQNSEEPHPIMADLSEAVR